jgi:2',3'-cyclic-nucleotide 2'-phosphodiesterase (5'-nucleotidase family)
VYRGAFENADVAVVNAGALRIGQDLPPYTLMGRRVVEELVQYENELVLVELTGARLKAMLEHSVSDWPSSRFLQVSGLAYRHDPVNSSVSDIHLIRPGGPESLAEDSTVSVVMPRFLADPTRGDQDGYGDSTAGGLSMTDVTASESSMRDALVGALKEAGKEGISPAREGRICRTDLPDRPCLLPAE